MLFKRNVVFFFAEALSWLRNNRNKWMEKFKKEIDCSLNSVIRQIEKPIRTADEDRVC